MTVYTPEQIEESRRRAIHALLTDTTPQCYGLFFARPLFDGEAKEKRCALGVIYAELFGVETWNEFRDRLDSSPELDPYDELAQALGVGYRLITSIFRMNDNVGATFADIGKWLAKTWEIESK